MIVNERSTNDAQATHTPFSTDSHPSYTPVTPPAPSNSGVTDCQKVNGYTPVTPPTGTNGVQMPMPRSYDGVDYYGAEDVAKIIGVTRIAVLKWQQKGLFTADKRAHDGRYLYLVERVLQLKSSYHLKWNQPAYLAHVDEQPPESPQRFTDDGDGFGINTPDKLDEIYLFLITRDLNSARSDYNRKLFERLPEADKRGIWEETWFHFGCGFIPDWILTKSRAEWQCGTYVHKDTGERKHLPPPSNRIIIPTPDMRHFNAIALASDRKRMKKDFWKQHAGDKALFYEKGGLSKAEIVIISEGEVDTMAIWQACIGRRTDRNFAPVAILGCSNWKNTLLPNLNTLLKGKKFLLLLDADSPGRTDSDKLRKALIQREVPAVSKFLYDELSDADKKFFDEKVDANDILIERGESFLNDLIEKILADAQADFEKAQQEISEQSLFSPANVTSDKPPRKKKYASNPKSDVEEIKLILKDYVHASNLGRDEWWSVGAILFRYGFTVDDFKAWSNDGDPRYSSDRCQTEWDSYANQIPNLKDDEGYKIGTLINLAKQHGYTPQGRQNPHVTGDEAIDRWQKINGVINPEWLTELKDAVAQINSLEFVTAANANDISIQRYLGMCRYYSFFASVDEKFFARLRDAKADAKKKIAAWNKDNSLPVPTDADKALATLDISNIYRKVEACLTQAKRAHQKYIDSTRRKEISDQREAEHATYVREQPTTRKEIADCPVDLILPEGVHFDDEGIKIEDTDKSDIRNERPTYTACQNIVVPTKIFREPSKHVTQYEIAIKTGKIWRRKVFDGRTLQDARSVSELGNFGAHIAEPRMMAKYFAKIIALNENNGRLEEIRSYVQPGWHDDDFSEFAYPTGGDDYVVLRNGFDFKKEFATHGDAEKWKKTFIDAMNRGGAVARIFTGTALAAPLVRPLHTSNMQIHLHGDINNGKTALELLSASIYGNPTKLFRTFESTPKNRQAVAAAYNDLPTFLDEMETRPTKEMEKALPQSVYAYFTGKANQANKRDGAAREPFYFSGARLSTGERPILSDNDQTGAFKRIVQIRCKKLFDPKFAATLYPFTENNFGHFGRTWTTYIVKHAEIIRKQFNSYVPLFTSQKIYEGTQVNSVVAAATAYQYFLICIGAQSEFDEDDFTKDIVAILELLPTNEELSGSERLLRALRSFVDGHPKNFVTQIKSTDPAESLQDKDAESFTETYGKIFNNGEVAIYPTALKKIIEKELGFASTETHITKWNEEGKLITKKDRTSDVIKIAGESKRVVHFKAGILSGEIADIK